MRISGRDRGWGWGDGRGGGFHFIAIFSGKSYFEKKNKKKQRYHIFPGVGLLEEKAILWQVP